MRTHSGGVGRPVRITYSGSNPNAAAVTIKKDGTTTTDTIATTEHLVITDFEIITETGGAVTILCGTGVQITKGTFPATGGGIAQNNLKRRGLKANAPTVTAAAGGQVDLTMFGQIITLPA